eukprot:scaffold196455_cov30-Tisochrysis_lutea.AAC.2
MSSTQWREVTESSYPEKRQCLQQSAVDARNMRAMGQSIHETDFLGSWDAVVEHARQILERSSERPHRVEFESYDYHYIPVLECTLIRFTTL